MENKNGKENKQDIKSMPVPTHTCIFILISNLYLK